MPKKIFLSHRFADKAIADTVRQHLEDWGFDNMIYQASAPGQGPRAGENITDELRNALYEAKLVILIYTLTDYDWSYCMWECGLATNPKSADTRTVVFQCSPHDMPKPFEGQLRISVDKEGIRNFTAQLHREPDFFPGEPAFRPRITDESLERLSATLYNELHSVIPPGRREERYRWDFLTLQLTSPDVSDIKKTKAKIEVREKILERSLVTFHFGEALKHFGFSNLEPGLRFVDLVERWREKTQGRAHVEAEWISGVAAEMHRAIDNSPASPEWSKLNSVNYVEYWLFPVVNHVRVMPDGSMEFDLYFYRSLGGTPGGA